MTIDFKTTAKSGFSKSVLCTDAMFPYGKPSTDNIETGQCQLLLYK